MPPLRCREHLLEPLWSTTDNETVRLYLGDVLQVLKRLPAKSVQCVVTSPPYWGLRDYQTGIWVGGDPGCEHKQENRGKVQYLDRFGKPGKNNTTWQGAERHSTVKPGAICRHCGAQRINDHQLGSELRPDCLGWARGVNCAERDWENGCHVCRMVLVFREVRRVLRNDGTLWLNYGDTYASGPGNRNGQGSSTPASKNTTAANLKNAGSSVGVITGVSPGNLVGIPWRVALALQADGWILRQDIIWYKKSPMPESVRNRCTKSHEYVFLLAKSKKYYCDMEAIKTPAEPSERIITGKSVSLGQAIGSGKPPSGNAIPGSVMQTGNTANKRSVWFVEDHQILINWLAAHDPNLLDRFRAEAGYDDSVWHISSQGYSAAHFATFPPKLIEPMILAGTSEKGACSKCGAPWRRLIESNKLVRDRPNEYVKRTGEEGTGNSCANTVAGVDIETLGWKPSCACYGVEIIKDQPRKPGNNAGDGSEIPTGWDVEHGSDGLIGRYPDRNRGGKTKRQEDYAEKLAAWEQAMGQWFRDWERLKPVYDTLPVRSCIVLDPFIGSGTTAEVCVDLKRWCWGIDLSRDYLIYHATRRVEAALRRRPYGLELMTKVQGRVSSKPLTAKRIT